MIGAVSCGGLTYLLSDDIEEAVAAKTTESKTTGLVPLIYSRNYNFSAFGLEKLHPFDSKKYDKIYRELQSAGLRSASDFLRPCSLTEDELLMVHSQQYLKSLKDSYQLARILEIGPTMFVPAVLLDWRILKPMRLGAGGTLLTAREALKHGIAINVGGGYHHASRDKGGGFCVYSDIPIAAKVLQKEGLVKKVMIVDTDAHQGNGFAIEAKRSDGALFVLDYYDEVIYPHPKVAEDWSVPFPRDTFGKEYLAKLEETLPQAIEQVKPDLIIYNAGSDVLASDPLSTLKLEVPEMNKRDLFVVENARAAKIPIAMVLAGGYGRESGIAHAQSIKAIINKYDDRT
jgi:histone deacetylase 11